MDAKKNFVGLDVEARLVKGLQLIQRRFEQFQYRPFCKQRLLYQRFASERQTDREGFPESRHDEHGHRCETEVERDKARSHS